MGAERVYLDHNATTPMLPAAIDAVREAMLLPGNPSSLHGEGRAARACIETAKRAIAASLSAKAENIIFTSGGTESAATLLSPHWVVENSRRHFSDVFVLATDHACLLAGGQFAAEKIRKVPVNADGIIDLGAFDMMLAKSQFPLVAMQHANSETGVIQPVAQISAIARQHLALIVLDAVQSYGKIDLDLSALDIDAFFVSAHKIGGPKGVGAIILSNSRIAPAMPLIAGGGQQKGFRAGTENVAGIAGFGAAAAAVPAAVQAAAAIAARRDAFEAELLQSAPDATIFGSGTPRLPNTSLFAVPGALAETSLIAFDLGGYALSSGSACSSGKVKRSHVLDAMGISPDLAACAIRMSIGHETSSEALQRFLGVVRQRIATTKHHLSDSAAQAA
jgi:cysteine desulfurase